MRFRFTLAALAALALVACQDSPPSYPARQPPPGLLEAPDAIAAGAQLFASRCASCHGKPSEGRSPRADFFQPPAPDFSDPTYHRKDPAYLFWRIEVGKNAEPFRSQGSVMPAWRGLSDQEIWQLVAYLKKRSL